uniref:Uncharacterized protein n=2 Tax=Opuntia streptacantha TaxID=393608 RepID=A0A7C9AQ97_OPUST
MNLYTRRTSCHCNQRTVVHIVIDNSSFKPSFLCPSDFILEATYPSYNQSKGRSTVPTIILLNLIHQWRARVKRLCYIQFPTYTFGTHRGCKISFNVFKGESSIRSPQDHSSRGERNHDDDQKQTT